MNDVAIRVENLSKRYRIGVQEEKQDTLVGTMLAFLKRPGRNLQRLRRLTRFSDNGADEKDIVWALRDVYFEVKQGEVIGVIGRNGAGKSTLLKILSRITYPTTGRVELHGRVSSLLEVGTGFHPELTGRENVYLNGTILGMRKKEIDKRFEEIVIFSGVQEFIDTPVKRYSSGMRVRLAFSVAAHLQSEILLVDEVLAVGDVEFQERCLGKMQDVASQGRTVFFVSHNLSVIQRLCRRAILFKGGIIQEDGIPVDVIQYYFKSIHIGPATSLEIKPNCGIENVRILVNSKLPDQVVWYSDETLRITITVHTAYSTYCPNIDVAFYRMDGLKLFAVRSEQIVSSGDNLRKTDWTLTFNFNPVQLFPQKIYMDVGVRDGFDSGYVALWNRACEIMVDDKGNAVTTQDSLLVPKVTVEVL